MHSHILYCIVIDVLFFFASQNKSASNIRLHFDIHPFFTFFWFPNQANMHNIVMHSSWASIPVPSKVLQAFWRDWILLMLSLPVPSFLWRFPFWNHTCWTCPSNFLLHKCCVWYCGPYLYSVDPILSFPFPGNAAVLSGAHAASCKEGQSWRSPQANTCSLKGKSLPLD